MAITRFPMDGTADQQENAQTDFPPIDLGDFSDPFGGGVVLSSSSGGSRIPTSYYTQMAQARTDAQALAQKKYEDELAAANAAAAQSRTGAQASADYFRKLLDTSTMVPGGVLSAIGEQEKAGQQYIADQYNMLSGLLGQRRSTAEGLQTQGFNALQNYLAQNPMQAYAQAQQAVPTVTQNILEQYMASRGLNTAPTQQATDVLNAQLAGGAANYNQLLNVLRGAETQQQQSRAAEEQMARTLAGANLGAIYGTATAGLEQTRLSALADLASRIQTARLQAERDRIAREQALQDAIAKILASGLVSARPNEQSAAPTGGGNNNGGNNNGGTTNGGSAPIIPSGTIQPIVATDPGIIAAAQAQGVSPQLLVDLATVSGNPMFGALQDRMYMV